MEDELDRIFSPQDDIVPSSGFAASVMEAVQREAVAPQPIPFPWVRAIPVFAALAAVFAMLIAGLVELARMPASAKTWAFPPAMERALMQANTGWIVFAIVLTLLACLLPIRLAAGKR